MLMPWILTVWLWSRFSMDFRFSDDFSDFDLDVYDAGVDVVLGVDVHGLGLDFDDFGIDI